MTRIKWYQKQWGGNVMTFITSCEENKIDEMFEYFKETEAVFKYELV